MEVNESLNELTSKQSLFIQLLLAGVNIAAAAKQIKIAETTAHRWLALPRFQQAYRQAKMQLFEDALDELKVGMPSVLQALRRHLMADVEPTPASQMQAVKIWSELATKVVPGGDEQEQAGSSYDLREMLAECSPEELAIINPIIKAVAARKAEQEQPGQDIPSIRRVK